MIHYRNGEHHSGGVVLDPAQPAFRYGAGFFETLYHDGSRALHLEAHLDRLFHSLRDCDVAYEAVDFERVIGQVVERNGLAGRPARVNIFYPVEGPTARPVVLAAPHEPRPDRMYRLCRCRDHHLSSLNAMKTTSYLFFHLALKRARARGFDDAALTDFDGNLLETTTGALLLAGEDGFVEMDTPYRLPSIALGLARTVLDARPAVVNVDDLPRYSHAYVLNSLVGMRPVVAIGETAFVPDESACRRVTGLVLGG
ncbi:aminotransferase class IV [Pseudodesulfovibrio sp.]|uniref:aminotransferase class IV n=1 Tax=Pseudodesulfovibrio sp. TaxID=2035812 RepID=UPI002631D4F0|nr:aminotransferase class IV [Pseudodesulfovibrio sp.]MDD3312078.1 aminotransferase class IV [Pseudodesulfovibrio sp.]